MEVSGRKQRAAKN